MLSESLEYESHLAWFGVWYTDDEQRAEKVALFVRMMGLSVTIHEFGDAFMVFVPYVRGIGEIIERVHLAFRDGENGL